jgi:chromosome segregation ATPase
MNEEELNKHIAKQQNDLDRLTRNIYGGQIKFESLSPFGQYTVESLARQRALMSDPDPELRTAKAEAATLRYENHNLQQKLTEALRENQDLWEKNEELLLEIYDLEQSYEQDRFSGRKGKREERST